MSPVLSARSKVTLFTHLRHQDSPPSALDLRPFLHHRLGGSSRLLAEVAHLPPRSALHTRTHTRAQSVGAGSARRSAVAVDVEPL